MARTTNLRRGQRRDQPRPILRRQTEKQKKEGVGGRLHLHTNMTSDSRKLLRGSDSCRLTKKKCCQLCVERRTTTSKTTATTTAKTLEKNGTAIVIQLEKLKRLSLLSIFWLLFFSVLSYVVVFFFVQKCQNIE